MALRFMLDMIIIIQTLSQRSSKLYTFSLFLVGHKNKKSICSNKIHKNESMEKIKMFGNSRHTLQRL